MSSNEETPGEQPNIRVRKRALNIDDTPPPPKDTDPYDPGPMVHYPPLPVGADGLPTPPALRQRIRDIRVHDVRAAREFTLRTLHAYMIAHRPMDEIARAFGVSIQRVYQWRLLLNQRMAAEFRRKTPVDLLVEQISHLQRAKAYSWQQASRAEDHADKCRWVNTAMKADAQIADLYARVGLIDNKTMQPAVVTNDEEDTGGKANTLFTMAQHFLEGHVVEKKGKGKKSTTVVSVEDDTVGNIDDADFLI